MVRSVVTFALVAALCAAAAAQQPAATMMPPSSPMQNMGAPVPAATLGGMPLPAEAAFVATVQKDLLQRFPTAATAVRAGYLRYTNEDETGAISYANQKWTSTQTSPSQLWYDRSGKLIGADFSVLVADSPQPPAMWGVDPRRWTKFGQHIHFGLASPAGTSVYGEIGAKNYAAAGGDPNNPTAAGLVAAGMAKAPSDVKFVFNFPTIWDLAVWLVPNPAGAFADANPNVKSR